MKKILSLASAVFSLSFCVAQKCPVPTAELKSGGYAVIAGNSNGQINKPFTSVNQVKFPAKGKEINDNSAIIKCSGIIPNNSTIKNSQILAINGLPKGLKWSTSKHDNNFGSGEIGCVFITGVPTEKGTFKVEIKAEGSGKYGFFSQRSNCVMKANEMTIVID